MIGPEPVCVALTAAQFPTATVMTETPADLAGALPFIKVVGIGGGRNLILGATTVDFECYGASRDDARTLAGVVNDWWTYQARGLTAVGSIISAVSTISLPAYRPYDNDSIRRFGFTLQVFLHDAIPATY